MLDRLQRLGMGPKLAIAFLGSLCFGLGSPPDGILWLIWVGFLPIALVVRVPGMTVRRAFLLGWVGGLADGLVGFSWIALLLERFGGFGATLAHLGLFAFAAWGAIPYGLWAIGMHLGPRGTWRSPAWGAALWVALAAAWPVIFPYTFLLGFAEQPQWIQAAEIGGVGLVEAQALVVSMLLADALVVVTARGRWSRVAIAAAIPLVSFLLGSWRMAVLDAEAEDARVVRFGIVQPNTPLRWHSNRGKVMRLREMSSLAQERGAQVVVWPEAGVYPYSVRRPFTEDLRHPRKRVLATHTLPTIFGAPSYEQGSRYGYNSVFNMTADGRVTGSFDKVNLMPFGEYIPVVDPDWARSYVPAMAHNLAGAGPARFVVQPAATDEQPQPGPSIGLGPLICYEDIFAYFAHSTTRQPGGLEAFVNVTIDTWFGDTAEPWEHLALAQFRSVEHRIPMVRSVSTGVSSVVDYNGRLASYLDVTDPTPTDLVPPQLLLADVKLPRNTAEQPTIYGRVGWLLPWLCWLLVVGVALAPLARNLYRRAPDGDISE